MAATTAHRVHSVDRAIRAVLIADVVESVRLIEEDEEGVISRWLALVSHIQTHLLPTCKGKLVKHLGDGMLLEFNTVQDALFAAFGIQRASDSRNHDVAPDRRILLRIGIEVDEVIIDKDDVYGRGVNLASRLATLAGPGEIVISGRAREQLTPGLDGDIEDLGDCYLKHFRDPVRAYRIRPPGLYPANEPGLPPHDLLPALAIVPFAGRDIAPEHNVLGEILAEEMIRELSRSPDVNVISRLSTTAFRGRDYTVQGIGAHLNADYVLSGIYRVTGQQVTLDSELAEAKSGQIIWAKRHKGQIAGILSGKRELIDHVVAAVETAVMSREVQRAYSQALPTLKSYTLMIAAIALMHRLSPHDFEEAQRLLETLVQRAPRQPVPQAWLAKWHVLRVQQGWSANPKEDAALALQCTRRALDTDPQCSLALAVDGFVHTNLLKRLDVGLERYERAIRTNPSDSLAWLLKGTLHAFKSEGLQAVTCTHRALRLSPLDPHRYFYDSLAATAHLSAHQFDRALKAAQRSLRANRTHTSTLRAMAVAQWHLGHHDAARATAQELLRLEPSFTVSGWLERSPSSSYPIGQEWANTFRELGIPN
jgi:class 3 adenylate cyclase/TolB-like protein